MAGRVLRVLPLLLLLTAPWPATGRAQDTDPPSVTMAAGRLELTTNGDPVRVLVDVRASEPSRFEVTATYASSYPQYITPMTAHYAYKTAAVGEHATLTEQLAEVVNDVEVVVGPRCYHSDSLTVHVEAIDGAGNRSDAVVAWQGVIDMPIGPVPDRPVDGTGYGVTAIQLGGEMPFSALPAEWSQTDVIICAPDHLLGSAPYPSAGYQHWVHDLREHPASRNVAVIAFAGGVAIWNNDDVPFNQRCYHLFDRIYQEARAAASPDTNVLAHLVDGSLATVVQPDLGGGSRMINLFSATARDTLAAYLVNEFNHFDNRLPNVGLMFDVWEYTSEYQVLVGGRAVFSGAHLDRDLDGVPMQEDYDAQIASRDGRLAFLRELRRRLYRSSADPVVGRHFLLGGNSVSARCDAEMAGLLDHIFVEDLQSPRGCGTGLGEHPYHNGLDPTYVRTDFPAYSLIDGDVIPYPLDFTSDFASLAAAMRDSAGGPFLTPESRGSCNDIIQPPVFNEVYGLLLDHAYPIWTNMDDPEWDRSWRTPEADGLPDLHLLGRALGTHTRTENAETLVLRRSFERGEVEIRLADADLFDGAAGDRFEYRVMLDGAVVREHAHWGVPEIASCFVAGWDSAGTGGTVRVDLTVLASEPVRFERSVRGPGQTQWSEPEATVGRSSTLAGPWETGIPLQAGDLHVRVRARDEAGQATGWVERSVSLVRFDGTGLAITGTRVLGTVYGEPQPGGGYRPIGRGAGVPDLSPPHFLEIRGTVADGFAPVAIRWQNSLGGEGTADAGADGLSSWLIPAVPLHRGFNQILITAEDASGAVRVGTVGLDWDYPGAPGSRGR